MVGQKGRDLALYISDGASPGTFTKIAGARSHTMTINNEPVEDTNKDSGGRRSLIEGAGNSSLDIDISGVFTDAAVEETFRHVADRNLIYDYRLDFANGDTISGRFHVQSYVRGGDDGAEETFSATLLSAGAWNFVAG